MVEKWLQVLITKVIARLKQEIISVLLYLYIKILRNLFIKKNNLENAWNY